MDSTEKEVLLNARFQRKATAHVDKICKAIGELGNVSNPKYYKYSQTEAEQMFDYIQSKLDAVKQAFVTGKKADETFKFQ